MNRQIQVYMDNKEIKFSDLARITQFLNHQNENLRKNFKGQFNTM